MNTQSCTLFFALLFSGAQLLSQACDGTLIFSEDFNSGSIPAGWKIENLDNNTVYSTMIPRGYTGQWQVLKHKTRKAACNTSRFTPGGTAKDYLFTPAITLPAGSSKICLSWKIAAGSAFFQETYDIRLSTTTQTVSALTSTLSTVVTVSNDDWVDFSVDLTAHAGKTIYIAFYHNTTDGYALFLDDVKVVSPLASDLRPVSTSLPVMLGAGATSCTVKVQNTGLSAVTGCSLYWSLDGGASQVLSGQTAPGPGLAKEISLPAGAINLTPGLHTLAVWVDGNGDLFHQNDTLRQLVLVGDKPRKVLVEEFTQASCGPCATQNPAFNARLEAFLAEDKITAIKYHTAWPGYDPMYELNPDDSNERTIYYGIGAVPTALVDGFDELDCGLYNGAPDCVTTELLDDQLTLPSVLAFSKPALLSTGSQLIVKGTFESIATLPADRLRLHVVLMEEHISYNTPPGNNGETDFPHVMRALLTGFEGAPLAQPDANGNYAFEYAIDINPEWDKPNLRAVVFVQDEMSNAVLQSEVSDAPMVSTNELAIQGTVKVFPTPTTDVLNILTENSATLTQLQITNYMGELIRQLPDGVSPIKVSVIDLAPGVYLLTGIQEGKRFTAPFIRL